ncbi:MAG TPA: hypothetical protein VM529_16445 [Gemmata sp.]|jgi:hypothetical protein|nr:hypothetical protein [Gemmata sp.]
MAKVKQKKVEEITISPPKFRVVEFVLEGTSPLMQARFSGKAMQAMMAKMAAGSTSKKGGQRAARDFDADFREAQHFSTDGWVGVPASAIRNACIDVCRMTGFKMTHAKMSIFVEADGNDRVDGMPLIRLHAADPERTEMPARNATGVIDIRVRPLWRQWTLKPRIRFDEDQFRLEDVANLLARAGMQIGIGEGRAFSKESNGLGFGFFRVTGGE